jgi:hypothetical protein
LKDDIGCVAVAHHNRHQHHHYYQSNLKMADGPCCPLQAVLLLAVEVSVSVAVAVILFVIHVVGQ